MEDREREATTSEEEEETEEVPWREEGGIRIVIPDFQCLAALEARQKVMHQKACEDLSNYEGTRERLRKEPKTLPPAQIEVRNLSVEVEASKQSAEETYHPPLTLGDYFMFLPTVIKTGWQRWRDRTVGTGGPSFPKDEQSKSRMLLHKLDFNVPPKTMTLLIGPAGSGKSTLMKLLANQLDKGIRWKGSFSFDGEPPDKRTHHLKVAYVTQSDVHIAQLSVRQTVSFASTLQPSLHNLKQEKSRRTDIFLKVLGLERCQNTLVGNDYIRGISGGEKKRLTVAVSMAKSPELLVMDEPTTGLDASTSLELFKFCRVIANEAIPVIACPLQPSSEIFFLFDYLLLLNSDGEQIYYGKITRALPFFARLGFICPYTTNPADFLLMISETRGIESTQDDEGKVLQEEELKTIEPLTQGDKQARKEMIKKITTSRPPTLTQVGFLTERGFAIQKNYPLPTIFRLVVTMLVALIYGSAYWQLKDNQDYITLRAALGFNVILYTGFSTLGNLGPLFEHRPTFYTQKRNRYYNTLSYIISRLLLDIPNVLVVFVAFGSIVYWMAGLRESPGPFLYFLGVIVITSLLIVSWVLLLSALMPNLTIASTIAPLFLVLMLLFTGFVITKNRTWDGLAWVYYISPFYYANQGLVINEMEGRTFTCTKSQLVPPTSDPLFNVPFSEGGFGGVQACPITKGDQFLQQQDYHTDNIFKVYCFLAVAAFFIAFEVLAFLSLTFISYPELTTGSQRIETPRSNDEESLKPPAGTNPQGYVTWHHLSYSVNITPTWWKFWKKKEVQLLNDVSGYVKPGMILALMGPSGAGKSTLLDVLAQRKTSGKVTGDIRINGAPVNNIAFPHQIGYVEQQSLHILTTTVQEAVEFSVRLRLQGNRTWQEKKQHVEWVLDSLSLRGMEDTPLFDCTFEQLKRVTIAVELAADPDILFLDEPTSGLGASSAAMVMNCVAQVVRSSGKAVICTIHQPSEPIFSLFTHLLLLKRGGELIYFGETTGAGSTNKYNTMLEYFDSSLGHSMQPLRNPADHAIDMCSVPTVDQVKAFKESPFHVHLCNLLEGKEDIMAPNPSIESPTPHRYASPLWRQFSELSHRSLNYYWRQPKMVVANVLIMGSFGCILGLMFLQIPDDQKGVRERSSLLFFTLLLGCIGLNSVIPLIIGQRPTFAREQAASTYQPAFYILAHVLIGIPFYSTALLALVIPAYFIGGLRIDGQASHFFFFLLVSFLLMMFFLGMNMLVAALLPTVDMAIAFTGTLTAIFSLFGGFLIPQRLIPDWWIWMYWISPIHFAYEPSLINEMEGAHFSCPNNRGAVYVENPNDPSQFNYYCPITSGSAYVKSLGFHLDYRWMDVGILGGEVLVTFILVTICVIYIKHINR